MRAPKRRILLRRTLQGVFLAAFLLVFFAFSRPQPAASQLDFEPTFQRVPVRPLCLIDPLASLAAFLASRSAAVFMVLPLVVVGLCLVFPRVFCSHVCPLGTLIDIVGAVRRRGAGPSLKRWKFIKYALLAAAVTLAGTGLGLAGLASPLPILTRALRAATSAVTGHLTFDTLWVGVLVVILLLSLVRRRLWCNVLCPTGALLSLVSRFSLHKRVRTDACVKCGLCPTVCDFDAIGEDDFETVADCAYCGECARVCKPGAIRFGVLKGPVPFSASRRDFLGGAGLTAGLLAAGVPFALRSSPPRLRPPGALPGDEFLARCIRCGLCAHVCPGPAISTVGLDGGLATYGSPEIVPERAGCSPHCNNCGRACPTGAIRHYPLEEKNRIVIGTAECLTDSCLVWQRRDPCGLCYDVCREAGHEAIEWVRRGRGEGGGGRGRGGRGAGTYQLVPSVDPAKCVGCGLCVTTCMQTNVTERKLLSRPAIAVTPKLFQTRKDL